MLSEATKYMYFNIDRKFFQTLEYKSEIQKLFEDNWFFSSVQTLYINNPDEIYRLNAIISRIRQETPELFSRLFHYPLKRTGNAEVLLFLLIQNAYLSVSSVSGRDIVINDVHYEVKNCLVSRKYGSEDMFYSNFKLGNTLGTRNIINSIEVYFGKIPRGSEIESARTDPEFLRIEEEYRRVAYDEYFGLHKMIFVDKTGQILYVGNIQKDDIFIDTITEGVIKPMILAR